MIGAGKNPVLNMIGSHCLCNHAAHCSNISLKSYKAIWEVAKYMAFHIHMTIYKYIQSGEEYKTYHTIVYILKLM